MFLSITEINRNLEWLEKNASCPVLYLTKRDLSHANPKSDAMRALWSRVDADLEIKKIFALQNENGSWFSGGPWGPRGYRRQSGDGYTATRPKFVTTAWILPFLGEVGYTADDERIRRGTNYILSEISDAADEPLPRNCCGIAAISLWGLASVGLADDVRLVREWQKLLNCQRSDGGWLNPHHLVDSPTPSTTKGRWPWDRSCLWGTYYAVRSLAATRHEGDRQPLLAASQFLLTHLGTQNPAHLNSWVYHGHNLVRELEIFCEAGIDMRHPTIQIILDWLRRFYCPDDGVFRPQANTIKDYPRQVSTLIKSFEAERGVEYWPNIAKVSPQVLRYSLYHLVEEDWLTYRLTGLAMNMQAMNETPVNVS
jgi:hypothetical protein